MIRTTGINFLINPDADKPNPPFASATPGSVVDVGNILIKLNLTDVRLADLLDAILLVADKPIKYSIQDYGVVFSAYNPTNNNGLYMRTFKVGTNIFPSRLMQVVGDGTETNLSGSAISAAARKFFSSLGVDLESPRGKSVFYNERVGKLFVKTTKADLDIIERAVQTLIQVEPQIHIKARFYEVPPGTFAALQKNLLQTNFGTGERMGILTGENFATMLRSLHGRADVEILAEPEVTTTSGRQTDVRATQIIDVVTNFTAVEDETNAAMPPQTTKIETGPTLDTVASVLADGVTINLSATAAVTDFLGYDTATNSNSVFNKAGKKSNVPKILPHVQIQQAKTMVNLWDGETLMLGKFEICNRFYTLTPVWSAADARPEVSRMELLVFITVTMVDPAGNRIHADGQLPFAQKGFPPQPK